jgi:acetyl esterase
MDESVRQFLKTTSSETVPTHAEYGSVEAREYLRRRRDRPRASRHLEPVEHVLELLTEQGVPVRVYVPADGPALMPLVVYFHGGGWVMGDLDMHDPTCRAVAVRSRSVVVNVGYRLAPEHPYPAPLDDCHAATEWAVRNASQWHADAARLILGGTSAGGNLAAAVAIRRRDAGLPPLAGLLLVYPVLDARMHTQSYVEKAEGYFLTAGEMRYFWDAYVQDARDRTHPWISPGLVEDLGGLPRTLVVTAEHDPLRDEGRAFAARLAEENLLLMHLELPGQIHGFLTAFPNSPAEEAGMRAIIDSIDEATAI